jgi:hypothetical protein
MTRTALVTGASLIKVGLRQRPALLWAVLLGATFSFPSSLWAGMMLGNSPNLISPQSEAHPTEQQPTPPSQSKENGRRGNQSPSQTHPPHSGTAPPKDLQDRRGRAQDPLRLNRVALGQTRTSGVWSSRSSPSRSFAPSSIALPSASRTRLAELCLGRRK